MKACGDFYILPSGVVLQKLLDKIFKEICDKNTQKLRAYWEKDYFEVL